MVAPGHCPRPGQGSPPPPSPTRPGPGMDMHRLLWLPELLQSQPHASELVEGGRVILLSPLQARPPDSQAPCSPPGPAEACSLSGSSAHQTTWRDHWHTDWGHCRRGL